MLKVFAFGFETRNKTISSLIYRLINEALLVADHISIRCHFSSWTHSLVTCSCVSVSVGVSWRWCTGVVFRQPGVKVNGAYYCDILLLKQLLPYICQAAMTFTFQCTTRAQEHRAAVTQDSGLHTRHVASQ